MQATKPPTALVRRMLTQSPGNSSNQRTRHIVNSYLFLLPAITLFITFTYYPLATVFHLSFTDADLISRASFVGIDNYRLLTEDPVFARSLSITVIFSISVTVLEVFIGMLLGFLMNAKMRLQGLVRAAIFTPVVVSVAATAILWLYFLNPNIGLITVLLRALGISTPNLLQTTSTALLTVILVNTWKSVGFAAVLFLAGLQAIPKELSEAAEIDGATLWQRTRLITVPLLSPTTTLVFFISLVGSFQAYGLVLLMTRGGPAGSTNLLGFYLYENAFRFFDMGYASAISIVLFIALVGISLLQFMLTEKRVHYQ